jgi:hypothetical protein
VKDSAERMITKFGKSVPLIRSAVGTYDPVLMEYSGGSETSIDINVVEVENINGTSVEEVTEIAYITTYDIEVGDIVDGQEVVSVSKTKPSNEVIICEFRTRP